MNAPASSAEIQSLPAKQAILVDALRPFLAEDALLWQPEDTIPYECDGLAAYRKMPLAVALPESEDQVVKILKACKALGVPVVRGLGHRSLGRRNTN